MLFKYFFKTSKCIEAMEIKKDIGINYLFSSTSPKPK